MPLPDHPNRDLDPNGTPADEGYMLAPPRKQSGPRQLALAPGYIWNGLTQELIPILPEDHPDHQENAETLKAAILRWGSHGN
jgi:hypothetical protein